MSNTGSERFVSVRRSIWALLLLGVAAPSLAQRLPRIDPGDLGMVYADLRFTKEFLRALGGYERYVAPRRMEHIYVLSDTLGPWISRQAFDYVDVVEPEWAGEAKSWQVIAPDSSARYRHAFAATKWAYLGGNYFTTLDTTATPVIRAHMESRFGPPTHTLVELGSAAVDEGLQFEYWFVLNDSIHVMVMDATGPLDRGIIFAGDHTYRTELFNLRQSFLGDIVRREVPASYTDYYYSPVSARWYQTGFDGKTFFTERIRRPNLARGRPSIRPR